MYPARQVRRVERTHLVEDLGVILERDEPVRAAIGANIYQNNGLKASQHEPHFHVHVVPKYEDSETEKLFLQRDYDVISIEEQRQIADDLRAALS